MPHKNNDNRVDFMERELEEMKMELQRLPELEITMEHLAQNFVKILQKVEETQKLVQTQTNAQTK